MFSKCWFFQRFTPSIFRWNSWEVWSFIDIFWVWNFSGVHTYYIHDENLEKFGLSSRFSKFGIFQRSILSTFRWNPWKLWPFINILWERIFSKIHTEYIFDETLEKLGLSSIFSECGIFQRSTLSTFSMLFLRSLVFHRYFLSVEFFWDTHLVHSRWNFREVQTSIEIFLVWNI